MTKFMAAASFGASNMMMPSYLPKVKKISRMVMFGGGLRVLRCFTASAPFPLGDRRVTNSILVRLVDSEGFCFT